MFQIAYGNGQSCHQFYIWIASFLQVYATCTYEQFSKAHSILDPFQLQDFLMAYLLESTIDFFDGALFELGFYCFDISLWLGLY